MALASLNIQANLSVYTRVQRNGSWELSNVAPDFFHKGRCFVVGILLDETKYSLRVAVRGQEKCFITETEDESKAKYSKEIIYSTPQVYNRFYLALIGTEKREKLANVSVDIEVVCKVTGEATLLYTFTSKPRVSHNTESKHKDMFTKNCVTLNISKITNTSLGSLSASSVSSGPLIDDNLPSPPSTIQGKSTTAIATTPTKTQKTPPKVPARKRKSDTAALSQPDAKRMNVSPPLIVPVPPSPIPVEIYTVSEQEYNSESYLSHETYETNEQNLKQLFQCDLFNGIEDMLNWNNATTPVDHHDSDIGNSVNVLTNFESIDCNAFATTTNQPSKFEDIFTWFSE